MSIFVSPLWLVVFARNHTDKRDHAAVVICRPGELPEHRGEQVRDGCGAPMKIERSTNTSVSPSRMLALNCMPPLTHVTSPSLTIITSPHFGQNIWPFSS
jgi:hypothetical protein